MLNFAEAAARANGPQSVALRSPSGTLLRRELMLSGSGDTVITSSVALSIASPQLFIEQLARLDGRVELLLLLSPALPAIAVAELAAAAGATTVVSDRADLPTAVHPRAVKLPAASYATRWGMTSSGTTGLPKIAYYRFDELAASVRKTRDATDAVWGLLYEQSRFAAVQVILQALLSGAELVICNGDDQLPDRVAWLALCGCTHISATPSLWRQILMLPKSAGLPLRQITLGGEIAEQRLLTALSQAYPQAKCTQIFASTEAGVAFSVHDAREGFSADLLARTTGPQLKVYDGMLWIKPARQVLGCNAEGFIATGDRVEIVGDRVLFRGRTDAVVKIAGSNVDLSEVERVVRSHAGVQNCVVVARANPISGRVLTLSVVPDLAFQNTGELKADIANWCRQKLPREAQPAIISIVSALPLAPSGKAKLFA